MIVELSNPPEDRIVRIPAGPLFDVVEFARAPDGSFAKVAVPSPKAARSAYGGALSATKSLLRDLKRSNVDVRRNTNVLHGAGSVFRDPKTGRNTIQIGKGRAESNPIHALLHEAGHLRKPSLGTMRAQAIAESKGRTGKAALLALRGERAANRGAVGLLRHYNASSATKSAFRHAMRPHYGSYRNAAAQALVRERGIEPNAPAVMRAGIGVLKRGGTPAEAERATEKLRKKLLVGYSDAKRTVSREHQGEFKKYFARRIDREATVNGVIDATKDNLPWPEIPHQTAAERVYEKIKQSSAARALAKRLALAGAGALAGGYVGYKTHGRGGIKTGAKTGAVAGLLFQNVVVQAAVTLDAIHHVNRQFQLSK